MNTILLRRPGPPATSPSRMVFSCYTHLLDDLPATCYVSSACRWHGQPIPQPTWLERCGRITHQHGLTITSVCHNVFMVVPSIGYLSVTSVISVGKNASAVSARLFAGNRRIPRHPYRNAHNGWQAVDPKPRQTESLALAIRSSSDISAKCNGGSPDGHGPWSRNVPVVPPGVIPVSGRSSRCPWNHLLRSINLCSSHAGGLQQPHTNGAHSSSGVDTIHYATMPLEQMAHTDVTLKHGRGQVS